MRGLLARVSRRLLPFAALVALLPLLPRTDAAESPLVGRRAAELHVYSVLGGPTPSIAGLKGRLVLLEFFRTACPHCQAAVPHLNELQNARFDRGLRVIGLCKDADDGLRGFAATFSTAYPLARMDPELYEDYDVEGVPTAVLVSPSGFVLWSGRPGDLSLAEVDRRLALEQAWPAIPPSLEGAAARLREGRFAQARPALEACIAAKGCGPAEVAVAKVFLAWMDRYGERLATAADAASARGDWYEAWVGYQKLADVFKETAVGRRAAARALELDADTTRGTEILAAEALAGARADWRNLGLAAGRKGLDDVVRLFPGTVAAAKATALAAKLRKRK